MIIHQPIIESAEGEVRITSHIEIKSSSYSAMNIPGALWFSYPETHQANIITHSDGFIISLLHVGMLLGENIEVRGSVSPRLAYGLEEYQRLFSI